MTGTYAGRTDMAYDAVDTGLHQDGQDLWVARDGQRVYLVSEHGVERLPAHSATSPGCS